MTESPIAPRRTSSEYLAEQQSQPDPVDVQPSSAMSQQDQMDFSPAEAATEPENEDDYGSYPDIERQESRIAPGYYKPLPEEEILAWTAPNRPFKARSRRFFTTILVIGLLVSLILFFAGQVLPVAVVFSIIFMVYMLSVVPPTQVDIRITTYGLHVSSELF